MLIPSLSWQMITFGVKLKMASQKMRFSHRDPADRCVRDGQARVLLPTRLWSCCEEMQAGALDRALGVVSVLRELPLVAETLDVLIQVQQLDPNLLDEASSNRVALQENASLVSTFPMFVPSLSW